MINRLVSALLLLLALCSPLSADSGEVVYYGAEMTPFIKEYPKGGLGGLAVDILREVARNSCGAIPEPVIRKVPWARALSECRHSPRSGILCMAMLPSRKEHFKWVGPIARVPMGVYTSRSSGIVINRPGDILVHRIGVVRGTAPITLLRETLGLKAARLEQVNSIRSMVRMLRAGRVELTILSEPGFSLLLREMDIPRMEFVKVYDLEPVELYFTFNREVDDGYINKLRAGLRELHSRTADGGPSRFEAICRKYFPQGADAIWIPAHR